MNRNLTFRIALCALAFATAPSLYAAAPQPANPPAANQAQQKPPLLSSTTVKIIASVATGIAIGATAVALYNGNISIPAAPSFLPTRRYRVVAPGWIAPSIITPVIK